MKKEKIKVSRAYKKIKKKKKDMERKLSYMSQNEKFKFISSLVTKDLQDGVLFSDKNYDIDIDLDQLL